jgi:SpoVK/Ycf46/Vps4 family AAA+-type ATPase
MLPKLISINERRRIVFIVATNHIDKFDFAIRRPGRFDLVVQVMPPNVQAKFKKWPAVKTKLEKLGIRITGPIYEAIRDLTYAEYRELNQLLDGATTPDKAEEVILGLHSRCTLRQPLPSNDGRTLRDECQDQRRFNRIPGR